ncbi:MAG: thrombospondin type 3 repeat-containing protein [Patescibacteria group bacterium]
MKKIIAIGAIIATIGFTLTLSAAEVLNQGLPVTSAFQQYKQIVVPAIKVPTVVEVPFSETFFNRFDFAVLDVGTNAFQPYLFSENVRQARTPVSVGLVGSEANSGLLGGLLRMLDGDTRTFSEFSLPENGQGQVRLVLTAQKPVALSGMSFFLDQYVALPTSVEVRARVSGKEQIVLARSTMQSTHVVFPKTTATEWIVSFSYGQLLRITEIALDEAGVGMTNARTLRFLAQPDHSYRVYFDADRSVPMRVGEAGNLSSDVGVKRLAPVSAQPNSDYTLADTDKDGVPDMRDNCTSVANPDQVDVDGNGRGDVCDDFDKDGVMNNTDNCPNNPNRYQEDVDGDKIGDVCDGVESRVTEKYAWLPWAGMGFAGLVLIVLFAITARSMMKKDVPPAPGQQM